MPDLAHTLGDLVAARYLRIGDALPRPSAPPRWSRSGVAGRLVEITGADASASLTAAFGLVLDAQQSGETAAWVTSMDSFFFPPDAAEGGIDLDTLPVVYVPLDAVLRAADKLARSGAFGLIVLDITPSFGKAAIGHIPIPLQSRLLGLAQRHDIAIVFLTQRGSSPPLTGSLVSLRGEARRIRVSVDQYKIEVRIIKDKRRAPGWTHTELCRGPAGLR